MGTPESEAGVVWDRLEINVSLDPTLSFIDRVKPVYALKKERHYDNKRFGDLHYECWIHP